MGLSMNKKLILLLTLSTTPLMYSFEFKNELSKIKYWAKKNPGKAAATAAILGGSVVGYATNETFRSGVNNTVYYPCYGFYKLAEAKATLDAFLIQGVLDIGLFIPKTLFNAASNTDLKTAAIVSGSVAAVGAFSVGGYTIYSQGKKLNAFETKLNETTKLNTSLQSRVDNIEENLDSNNTSITDLSARIDTQNTSYRDLDLRFRRLIIDLRNILRGRLTTLDDRCTRLDDRCTRLDDLMREAASLIDGNNQKLIDLKTETGIALESLHSATNDYQQRFEAQQTTTNRRLTNLEVDVSNYNADVATHLDHQKTQIDDIQRLMRDSMGKQMKLVILHQNNAQTGQ